MNLKHWSPPRFVAEIHQHIKSPTTSSGTSPKFPARSDRPRLVETVRFATRQEAEDYSASKTKSYGGVEYIGSVREAGPRDRAEQRLEEIAEAIANDLRETISAEEENLSFDTRTEGKPDVKGILLGELEELAETLYEEETDPVQNGWVGDNGLP